MKPVHRAHHTFVRRDPTTCPTALTAVTVNVLILALAAPARGADQPRTLSVHGQEVIRLAGPAANGRVYDLAFSPRPNSCVCAFALEQAVQVWDLSTKPRVITTVAPARPRDFAGRDSVTSSHPIAFSSDGAQLALGYFLGVQIWHVDQRKLLFGVPFLWSPEAVRFSPMESSLVVGCSYRGLYNIQGDIPNKIEVWPRGEYEGLALTDPKSPTVNRFRVGRAGIDRVTANIYGLAISPEGKRLVAGGDPVFIDLPRDLARESSVTVFDMATGRRMFDIGDKEVPILRFCLSPNGRVLYTCGKKLLGCDAMKPAPPIQKFDESGRRMISVAVSPDGTMLAAGGLEGTVVIWHIDSAARLATLTHNGGPVYGLAFSQTSGKLVAAGEKGVATVWDIELLPKRHN